VTSEPTAHTLSGIDGRNPCGFLAALGALRLLTDHPDIDNVRLAWGRGALGAFHPALEMPERVSHDDIAKLVLDAHLNRDLDAELGWSSDVMKLPCEKVRNLLVSVLGGTHPRVGEMIGACVVDVPRRQRRRPQPDRLAAYTPLRLIPRVGRARFVRTALAVSRSVTEARVRTALFGPWGYVKTNSLRWDPGARVPLRAYSAEAPTNFGPLGVPGAVALAVAALCYFPLAFDGDSALCAGLAAGRAPAMRWPLWEQPLDEAAVRLILGIPAIHEESLDTHLLSRHGIIARVSARRERVGDDGQALAWGDVDLVEASAMSQ
jgi:hypothetical protein